MDTAVNILVGLGVVGVLIGIQYGIGYLAYYTQSHRDKMADAIVAAGVVVFLVLFGLTSFVIGDATIRAIHYFLGGTL